MTQMVDDLLDTSKLRAGLLRVDREPCEVSAIFAAVHPIVDGRAAGSRIQWIEEIEPGLPRVFADQEKAVRVLVNLAVNAIKFSPEGSRIFLSAKAGDEGEVVISVKDEGPGISPENLAAIFERFRQVGNVPSSTKGFGLGLNIAKELVSLNLGTMSVSSELQHGSTFGFTLPVNDPAVIVSHLFGYLERLRTPAGKFAILRVTPEQAGDNSAALRGFLACSAHPGDVILSAGDEGSLILFGYTSEPEGWLRRLTAAAANIQQFGPNQKLCALTFNWSMRCRIRRRKRKFFPIFANNLQESLSMPEKVLVIDDDRDLAWLTTLWVRAAGFEAVMARDGTAGLATAHSYRPDIILLDIMMPGIDGFEVSRQLKEDPELAHVPVIFLSAKVQETARTPRRSRRVPNIFCRNRIRAPIWWMRSHRQLFPANASPELGMPGIRSFNPGGGRKMRSDIMTPTAPLELTEPPRILIVEDDPAIRAVDRDAAGKQLVLQRGPLQRRAGRAGLRARIHRPDYHRPAHGGGRWDRG